MKPGIYYDLPNHKYHHCEGISKSGLDLVHRSPAHYKASLENPEAETPAMILGSAVHAAILEPEKFQRDYLIPPDFNKKTKAGAAAFDQWAGEYVTTETVLLTKTIMSQVMAMRDSVLMHPQAGPLLEQEGKSETSVFWYEDDLLEQLGAAPDFVMCKCRPDRIISDGTVLDLKTTTDARPNVFAKSVANFRYHVQQAYYSAGMLKALDSCGDFIFIAVEKEPPYAVNVLMLDENAVLLGREAYREDLFRYIQCMQKNEWPAYETYIQTIGLPRWAE